jgi:putative SOS response-associated peptidase YedK
MYNLYSVTTTGDAVLQFTKAFRDPAGWNEASFDVYPGYQAPIGRLTEDGSREIAPATWGMPSPPAFVKNYDPGVTNIRNASSPHWRRWMGLTSRCVVPFTSFVGPDPASKAAGGRVPNACFAGNEDRPLMFFAGFWTPWKGIRRVRDGEQEYGLFGFLTTTPNEIVEPIHQTVMPSILTTPEGVSTWLTAPWDEAKHLQRPLPGNMLVIVPPQPTRQQEDEGLLP